MEAWWVAYQRYDSSRGSLIPWIKATVRGYVKNYLKDLNILTVSRGAKNPPTCYTGYDDALNLVDDHSEMALEVEETKEQLCRTSFERRILELRYNGHTIREIAEELGVSKSMIGEIMQNIKRRYLVISNRHG